MVSYVAYQVLWVEAMPTPFPVCSPPSLQHIIRTPNDMLLCALLDQPLGWGGSETHTSLHRYPGHFAMRKHTTSTMELDDYYCFTDCWQHQMTPHQWKKQKHRQGPRLTCRRGVITAELLVARDWAQTSVLLSVDTKYNAALRVFEGAEARQCVVQVHQSIKDYVRRAQQVPDKHTTSSASCRFKRKRKTEKKREKLTRYWNIQLWYSV